MFFDGINGIFAKLTECWFLKDRHSTLLEVLLHVELARATELRGQGRSQVQLGNEGKGSRLRDPLRGVRRLPEAGRHPPIVTSAATSEAAELECEGDGLWLH